MEAPPAWRLRSERESPRPVPFVPIAPDPSLHTCAIQSFATEFTGAITEVIGSDHPVSSLECSDLRASILNHAHPFMSDLPAWLVRSLTPIRPQVGATNTGMGNPNHGVSWCENGRIRDLLHLDSKCSTKNGCTHRLFLPLLILTSNK